MRVRVVGDAGVAVASTQSNANKVNMKYIGPSTQMFAPPPAPHKYSYKTSKQNLIHSHEHDRRTKSDCLP